MVDQDNGSSHSNYLQVTDTGTTFEVLQRPDKRPTNDESFRRGLIDTVWVSTVDDLRAQQRLQDLIHKSQIAQGIQADLRPIMEFATSDEAVGLTLEKNRQRATRLGKFMETRRGAKENATTTTGGELRALTRNLILHGDAFCAVAETFISHQVGVHYNANGSAQIRGEMQSQIEDAIDRTQRAGRAKTKNLEDLSTNLDRAINEHSGPNKIPLLVSQESPYIIDKHALATRDWPNIRVYEQSASTVVADVSIQCILEAIAYCQTDGGSLSPDFDFVLSLERGLGKGKSNDIIAVKARDQKKNIQLENNYRAKEVLAEQVDRLVNMRGQALEGEGYPIAPSSILLDGPDGEKINLVDSVRATQEALQVKRRELLVRGNNTTILELNLAKLTQAVEAGEVLVAMIDRVQAIWGQISKEQQEAMIAEGSTEDRDSIVELPQQERNLALVDIAQMPKVTEEIAGASFDLDITVTEAEQIITDLERLVAMRDVIGVNIAGETATMHIEGSKLREILADPNMPDVVKDRVASLIINTPLVGYPPREEMIDSVFANITPEQRGAILELRSRVTANNRSEIINADLVQDDIHYDLLKRRMRARLRATHQDSNKYASDVVQAGARAAYNLLNEVNQHIEKMRVKGKGIKKEDLFV